MKRVFLLHLVGNAVLILLLYAWLGIRDARAVQIAVTVLLGAALLGAALWLHAGTWHWMRAKNWRVPFATLLRGAGGFLVFAVVLWLLSLIPVDAAALWTASLLTFKTRKPVTPESVGRVYAAAVWLLKWFVLPVILLGQWKRPRFWLLFAGVLLIGWYFPRRLVHWTPDFKTTTAEAASMLARWSVAYLLGIACWLAVLRESATAKRISSES